MSNDEEYDNTNTIRMFKVDSDNDKAPAFSGTITFGKDLVKALNSGKTEDLEVSIWKKKSAKGKGFYAGVVQLPWDLRQDDDGSDDEGFDEDEDEDDDDF